MIIDAQGLYVYLFFQNLQFWLREVLVSFLLVLQMIVRVKRNAIQIPGDSIRHECCGHETCCFDFWSSSHQYFDRFSFWHICEVESAKLMHRIVFNFFHNIKTLDFINLFLLKIVIKKCLGDHFGCPNNYVSFFTCYYPRTTPPERCLGYYKTCTVLLGMQKLTLYLITLTPNPIHGIP